MQELLTYYRSAVDVLVVGLVLTSVCFCAPTLQTQTQRPPMRIDVRLKVVEATVWDSNGMTIDTLNKEDFILLDNGVQQSIALFSRDSLPLAVVLVVDVSGSMIEVMGPLRRAALDALQRLKPEDSVALFTFGEEPVLRVPLTKDKSRVAAAIQHFSAEGGTDIHQALVQSAAYLKKAAPQERRIIILASDDFAGTHRGGPTPTDVLHSLQEIDTTLYNLKIRNKRMELLIPREKAEASDLVQVPRIAGETGGVVVQVYDTRGLSGAFGTLISILKNRYTLGFYLNEGAGDARFHKLDLQLIPSKGIRNKDYRILAQDGYYARSTH